MPFTHTVPAAVDPMGVHLTPSQRLNVVNEVQRIPEAKFEAAVALDLTDVVVLLTMDLTMTAVEEGLTITAEVLDLTTTTTGVVLEEEDEDTGPAVAPEQVPADPITFEPNPSCALVQ